MSITLTYWTGETVPVDTDDLTAAVRHMYGDITDTGYTRQGVCYVVGKCRHAVEVTNDQGDQVAVFTADGVSLSDCGCSHCEFLLDSEELILAPEPAEPYFVVVASVFTDIVLHVETVYARKPYEAIGYCRLMAGQYVQDVTWATDPQSA